MADDNSIKSLRERLARALKAKAVLAERSKQLQRQVDDFRNREEVMSYFTYQLLERQRELNLMLHRASSVLHQLQEKSLALSAEFSHLVKELPAPDEPAIQSTIEKVNDLFQKTHELAAQMESEIFGRPVDYPTLQDKPGSIPSAAPDPPAPEPAPAEPAPQAAQSAADDTPSADCPPDSPADRLEAAQAQWAEWRSKADADSKKSGFISRIFRRHKEDTD